MRLCVGLHYSLPPPLPYLATAMQIVRCVVLPSVDEARAALCPGGVVEPKRSGAPSASVAPTRKKHRLGDAVAVSDDDGGGSEAASGEDSDEGDRKAPAGVWLCADKPIVMACCRVRLGCFRPPLRQYALVETARGWCAWVGEALPWLATRVCGVASCLRTCSLHALT